jgi:VWFA-related protein
MVFDKQGSFVDGLKRDQFVLKIDGKPRDISFFERIAAGSRNEEAQIAAARGTSGAGVRPNERGPLPLDRGRTVFFFIDDLHLSPASNKQARVMLQRFVDREMGQNDEAAIASASGQIGFLQQLTNDKRVLHAATERLMARSFSANDADRPPMSEYQAQMIELRNEDVLGYFVTQVMRLNPGLPREAAEAQVNTRASQMLQQAAQLTNAMLSSLDSLVKTSAGLPGRKLIVLVSDGFLMDSRNSDSYQRLHQITSAAAAAGVVIYSIDARGLTTGMPDMSVESPFDPSGRLMRGSIGDLTASQDGLNALAVDTGGRALFNNNDLLVGVTKALKETAAYYLLAWRPEEAEQNIPKSRHIEVSISGRPDLVVRFHHGFGDSPPAEPVSQKKKDGKAGTKPAAELMVEALRAVYPKTELPISISLSFLDLAQVGPTLTTSIKISTNSLVLEAHEDQQLAAIDVAGAVYDDQGKSVSSFNKHLTIKSKSSDAKATPPDSVFYNHFCTLKPGLYQVRVATVDPKRGRAGSAVSWIEIPDLSSKTLTLSSLIVGERETGPDLDPAEARPSEPGKTPEALGQIDLNVDHHFASSSHLRFLTFVYNASGGSAPAAPAPTPKGASEPTKSVPANSSSTPANGPDLAVQVQLFRDDEPVITMPLHKIQVNNLSDSRRLPYAAEINLAGLRSGRYLLLVTVIDRAAKASASQRFGFQID